MVSLTQSRNRSSHGPRGNGGTAHTPHPRPKPCSRVVVSHHHVTKYRPLRVDRCRHGAPERGAPECGRAGTAGGAAHGPVRLRFRTSRTSAGQRSAVSAQRAAGSGQRSAVSGSEDAGYRRCWGTGAVSGEVACRPGPYRGLANGRKNAAGLARHRRGAPQPHGGKRLFSRASRWLQPRPDARAHPGPQRPAAWPAVRG